MARFTIVDPFITSTATLLTNTSKYDTHTVECGFLSKAVSLFLVPPGVLLYLWFVLQNFLKLEDLSIFSTLLLWTKVVLKFP